MAKSAGAKGLRARGIKMEQAKIDRIGELYRKSKASGLTEKEQREQRALREEYLRGIRQNLTETLDHTVIVDEGGRRRKLEKREGE